MGYGAFVAMLEDESNPGYKWLRVVTNFLVDPGSAKDFRLVRYERLIGHLVDLVKTLDEKRLPETLKIAVERHDRHKDTDDGAAKKLA